MKILFFDMKTCFFWLEDMFFDIDLLLCQPKEK